MEGSPENLSSNHDECPVFMKANREMKRLFVGGLGQGISETDLQNQFSRFGEVSNVEIITRKDDQGNSQKVFAYVNIKITEADLKKCMSVLNKTKWKGGTLQIQLAKESFLHRLAQEREEAKAKKENPTSVNTNLVEKMGGVDFHMKAVPGTEVPGHKKIKKVQKGPMESKVSNISLRTNEVMESNKSTQPTTVHRKAPSTAVPSKSLHVPSSGTQKPKHMVFHTSDFEIIWNKSRMSDDDIDSEEELKVMIAKEENLQKTRHSLVNESENDPFEVVRDDFKSDTHRLRSSTSSGNDSDCDSSDTDKIIAMKKNTVKVKNSAESSQPEKSISMRSSFKKIKPSNDCVEVQNTKSNKESALGHEGKFLNPKFPPDSNTSDSEESEEDEEYKALMKNCPRVNLTLADLECLAGSHQKVPGNDESDGSQNSSHCKFNTTSKSPKTSNDLHSGRQCICPEEIVASLLEEENTYSRQKTEETTLKPKFQAFKGIGGLYAKESGDKTLKETVDFNNINEQSRSSLKHEEPDRVFIENGSKCTNGSSNKLTSCQPAKKVNNPNHIQSPKRQSTSESQSHKVVSFTCFDKESQNPLSCPLPLKGKKSLSAKSHKIESDRDTCHQPKSRKASEKEDTDSSNITSLEKPPKVSFREDPQKSTASFSLSVSDASCMSAKDKHAEDNQKRLAALAVWQKAREVQKKLVHNALANLDAHPENKKTHIVFASDNESETEETSTQEQNSPGKELVTESVGKASGKLFDSSDDEDSDSKEDSTRFNIKPQFEGRAGQKLMDLQSHFGNDERFRMDSRFLESDSEEEQQKELNEIQTNEDELAAERKQTLNVVQSVLNINLSNPTSKGAVAVKKFKDIVHYDPTKHDHAIYERKQEDNEKESKVKRKKKREEAEKLPEVSQDMYHNITTDLKEIFQHTKNTDEKEEDTPWNEDCGREETEEVSVAATLTSGAEHTSGFTFSFFDSDTKDIKEDTYRTEPVKRGKIVYQEDPRFQDSSSEEEEEEVTKEADHKRPSPGEAFPVECTRFFFFSENDDRLHGRSILPFSGVEQVVVQLLLIVYSTQLHLQVLTHCSLMCFIPLHYKAFRGQ
ncbi:nucleolar protein 8 isoform X4 [Microtus ochrogaster]|uniref:Nucleolar protein 8 isoform X4 n=1 Tax=Microtus ochrogaster TaxID=79684 RepID=A0ABM1UA73_MICOH|nr:nucleolar protein 8 isoform X4 [Microtus ochrogaster]